MSRKQSVLISTGTGAVTAGNQIAFTARPALFRGGNTPVLSVKGLAGIETVDFWVWVNGTWEELADSSGTQVQFTATRAADTLNSPGDYGITKSATAGSITVQLNDGR